MLASNSLHNKDRILWFTLAGTVTVISTLFTGCSPAGFAASAILFRYWEGQVQKEKAEKIRLARQQESVPVPRKPETVRTFVPLAEDKKTVEKANQAYRDLNWDESTRLLNEALNRGELSRADEGEAYILLGSIAYQQGQVSEAESYFKKTLEIDNSVTPSAELYPPPLIEFYKSVGKRK